MTVGNPRLSSVRCVSLKSLMCYPRADDWIPGEKRRSHFKVSSWCQLNCEAWWFQVLHKKETGKAEAAGKWNLNGNSALMELYRPRTSLLMSSSLLSYSHKHTHFLPPQTPPSTPYPALKSLLSCTTQPNHFLLRRPTHS